MNHIPISVSFDLVSIGRRNLNNTVYIAAVPLGAAASCSVCSAARSRYVVPSTSDAATAPSWSSTTRASSIWPFWPICGPLSAAPPSWPSAWSCSSFRPPTAGARCSSIGRIAPMRWAKWMLRRRPFESITPSCWYSRRERAASRRRCCRSRRDRFTLRWRRRRRCSRSSCRATGFWTGSGESVLDGVCVNILNYFNVVWIVKPPAVYDTFTPSQSHKLTCRIATRLRLVYAFKCFYCCYAV